VADQANPAQAPRKRKFRLSGGSEAILAVAVVGILMVMIIPIPTGALDIFLAFNITFAIVILLTAMYTLKPLDFSIFPGLLLMTTLYRLALNVASTRLILLHGNEGPGAAGQVIKAFGSFVVGGNYFVGLVIFVILVIVNFIVITKGAERIAEVAARFTLDAMPGKQMAIDADLNAGLIGEGEARKRREVISQEADFYGAMDGAAKFVRGDAIAAIIITLINIIGGLLVGVIQQRMDLSTALQNYTILTIGDGLVSQIPALIISTSAGLIVSRAASGASMGKEFARQFSLQPRALFLAGCLVFFLGLVPGLPTLPFIILGGGMAALGHFITRAKRRSDERQLAEKAAEPPPSFTPEQAEQLLPLDLMELEVGYGLIPLVDEEQQGDLLERIKSIRQQFALEMGIIVPPLHVRDNLQLKPGEYAIIIKGNEITRTELMIDYFLAMDPGDAKRPVDEAIPTREPAFNLPAFWVPESKREEAQFAGFSVVDLSTVVATHLSEIIRTHAHELLGRQEVQRLLDNLAKTNPKVVEELVPSLLSLGQVQKVLQNLLRERVSIRDLLTILETLADYAATTKDPDILTEYARQSLSRSIVRPYVTAEGVLPVMTSDPQIEDMVAEAVQTTEHGSYLNLDPGLAQKVIVAVQKKVEEFMDQNLQPILLTSPLVRRHFRRLMERFVPVLVVVSHNELVPDIEIRSLGMVNLTDAD